MGESGKQDVFSRLIKFSDPYKPRVGTTRLTSLSLMTLNVQVPNCGLEDLHNVY